MGDAHERADLYPNGADPEAMAAAALQSGKPIGVPLTEATPPILVLLSFVFGGFKGGKKKLVVQKRHQRLESFDFSDYDAVVSVEEESEADRGAGNDQTNLGNLAGSGVDDGGKVVISTAGGAA